MKAPIRLALTVLAFLGVSVGAPRAQAYDQNFPDGDYPGNNTAEGALALRQTLRFYPQPPPPGFNNTALGFHALTNNTDGDRNTATGAFALESNTAGSYNTANGDSALLQNTTGFNNTAIGARALFTNTTGNYNTATGVGALQNNATGNYNTATGVGALQSNTVGRDNTATGAGALDGNTTGLFNTANGARALKNNTTGGGNTASGREALYSNTTGRYNTATGNFALYGNTTDDDNTATGNFALLQNTTGFNNTAIGARALLRNTTGSFNIALGLSAGNSLTGGDRNIDIGNDGEPGESATIRIGTVNEQTRTFIAGIVETTLGGGDTVFVNNAGKLGVHTSSARFKDEIKPLDEASEAILALRPVTFRYKKEIDPQGIPQFGLVAEDVEKVNPDLVVRDKDGKPYTVRYEAVNAMLLNEFLKEHREVEQQERKLAQQETIIAQLKSAVTRQEATAAEQWKEIEALTANLQKVTEQVALSKPAPRMVLNHR